MLWVISLSCLSSNALGFGFERYRWHVGNTRQARSYVLIPTVCNSWLLCVCDRVELTVLEIIRQDDVAASVGPKCNPNSVDNAFVFWRSILQLLLLSDSKSVLFMLYWHYRMSFQTSGHIVGTLELSHW
jgi:hypothetical protein